MTAATYPLYEVTADAETGEWLDEPKDMGRAVKAAEWHAKRDNNRFHYDTYEHFADKGSVESETRAIRVKWAR